MVMVINKRIWRALRENLAQYTGSMVLIILSCLMFTVMTLLGENLQRLVQDFATQAVQEDASFSTDKSISDLPALQAAANASIEEGKMLDYPLSDGVTLRIFSQNETINRPGITQGSELQNSGGILLHPVFAKAHGYKIGDQLTIMGRAFNIVGYMALPNYIYPLQADTDIMYSQQQFGIAVISKADFAALGQGSSFYAVKYHQAAAHPRAQAAEFRALLLSRGIHIQQWTDTADNKRVSYVTLKLDAINSMSKVMPTTLLLLTSILICTVIGRLIHAEAQVIGALYALGYRKPEILRHYLVFPLVIAAAGGLIGTALGLLIVRPMLLFMLTAFTVPLTGINYNPLLLLTSLLLPLLFLGISSALVIWNALKHSPVELMKGDQARSQVNFLERALKLDRLPFATKFKIREQLRSLSRLAFLLAGCAIATMLLLYGFTIKSSLDYLTANSMTGTFHFQYEYQYKSQHSEPPPAGAEPFNAAIFLPSSEAEHGFYVSGVMPDSKLLAFVDSSGKTLRTDQVLITKPLAERLKLKPGDTFSLVRKVDGKPFTLKIDAVADTYVGKYVFMPLVAYNQTFGLPAGSYVGLWSPTRLTIPEEQLYSQKSIDETMSSFTESMASIRALIVSYSAIAFVIGLIVVYLVTSMLVEENKVSISLMKIFGYRKKEVNALILNSSTFIVILGYILGVPLILASISGLLQSLDNSVGITLPVRINPIFILVGFVIILLAYQVSKWLCRKKVDAVPMSEALKAGME